MVKNYYTACADKLEPLRPAFGQIAADVLKKMRSCIIKRLTRSTVRFYLNNPLDDFYFTIRREIEC